MINDLSGRKFGRLTVIDFNSRNTSGNSLWNCVCDCGAKTVALSSNLATGHTKSCGCLKSKTPSARLIDITGNVYGRLTVVSNAGMNSNNKMTWRCICECGNEATVAGDKLKNGHTQSCGCFKKDRTIEAHTTHGLSKTVEYFRAQHNKRRELEILLDSKWTGGLERELRNFFKSCVVCGGTENLETDHVIPLSEKMGLSPGNAIILCRKCNSTKNKFPLDKLPKRFSKLDGLKMLATAEDFKFHCIEIGLWTVASTPAQ